MTYKIVPQAIAAQSPKSIMLFQKDFFILIAIMT